MARFRSLTVAGGALLLWAVVYAFLQSGVDALIAGLHIPLSERWGTAVAFFVYEAPKVLLLLTLVVFLVGIVRTYFSPARTRRMLGNRSPFIGNVLASMLGIVTPFCSCSAVPLFIGFVEGGIPLGVTFSFLIAAPMINEVAVVLLLGLFGWQTALLYVVTGLFIAIIAGAAIGRMSMERHVEPWVYEVRATDAGEEASLSPDDRVDAAAQSVREIVGRVWPYLLAGIAIGSLIHGYVPEQFMAGLMGRTAWWAVPAAVLLGVPLYSNAAGIIPIVQALLSKGAALGTTLAFMMSVIGLSLPEVIILRKVLRPPLIAAFVGVVAVGIVIVGYFFNFVLG